MIARRYPGMVLVTGECNRGVAGRLAQGRSFALETPFCEPSALKLMAKARAWGFEIVLYIVCLDEPRQLQERVSQRARQGGQVLPGHQVITRYAPALALLQEAMVLADLALLIDGAAVEQGGPSLVASLAGRQMLLHTPFRPRWADKLLGFAER